MSASVSIDVNVSQDWADPLNLPFISCQLAVRLSTLSTLGYCVYLHLHRAAAEMSRCHQQCEAYLAGLVAPVTLNACNVLLIKGEPLNVRLNR